MAGRTLAVPVATALSLLFLLLNASPCAATRPVPTRRAASSRTTAALAVPPSASNGAQRHDDGDAMARAGKWLPYPYQYGGVHYPGYPRYTGYPSQGKPAAWAAPSLGAYGGKTPSPYVDVTRQEQVAMWASLLNPAQRPNTTPASWLPAGGDDEPAADQARDEPNRALDAAAAQGAEMDVPAGGGGVQNKWGVYEGSSNNGK